MQAMNRRQFIGAMGVGVMGVGAMGRSLIGRLDAAAARSGGGGQRPNIVLIMSDDMGFSDIGCYGGEIHTPNLDRLAAEGLRFTQFYNTARCCPTRASLMSGLYQHQAGVGHMMGDRGYPGYRGDLSDRCVTIAEVLKGAGYGTYMAGKWHLTPHTRPDGPKYNWPRQRGFDRFFGTIHGAGSFYDPNSLTLDNQQIAPWEDFYYTEAISEYACRFIREHAGPNPFFVYVAYTAAHWPMHAREEDIAKYKGRYKKGWDALRAERYERLKKMGLIDPAWALTLRDERVPAWEDEPLKAWNERRMEVYAAMIDNMDRGIGRIVETLRRKGQLDNTLIFFLQDNGGCAEEMGSTGPVRPDGSAAVKVKLMGPGELQTRMVPLVTRDGRPVRQGRGVMPGPADTYVAYGRGWANASNTPFRLYKHWVHEGGISTPLIVHWPARIKDGGRLRDQPGHLIDIMATCVDVSGAAYPERYRGKAIRPMEGRSLVPAFEDRPIERPEGLFWEHEGNRAVRDGDWKLVSKYPGGWELYNLRKDRTEMHNVIDEYPQVAERLKVMYETWAARCQVVPWGRLTQRKKAPARQPAARRRQGS